jgi:hypothetical protein
MGEQMKPLWIGGGDEAMNIIKTDLRNRMSDEWPNDLILCYIEKEIFTGPPEKINRTIQSMKDQKMSLPPSKRPRWCYCFRKGMSRN